MSVYEFYSKIFILQVVFQSSTVGVLLADPTQAKVKVKFEGKAAGEPDDIVQNFVSVIFYFISTVKLSNNLIKNMLDDSFQEIGSESEPQLQYGPRDVQNANMTERNFNKSGKSKYPSVREDKGKDLGSLGYAVAEPIDWMRVQLPKKQDLFQEFYRRIHNHV